MIIKILEAKENQKYFEKILKMLYESDNDFVPPLSSRSSTTQSSFKESQEESHGVLKYFEKMKNQKLMVATEEKELLAFVSYIENYTNEEIKKEDTPNIYVSTLIVSPSARGRKITSKMYEMLFAEYRNVNIFTRTWSENKAHINILSKFGFNTRCILENDRGEGIHTIYFEKRPTR